MNDFTHLDEKGRVRMVDVTDKPTGRREARAGGCVRMMPETLAKIGDNAFKKGNVLETARIAGIMAAKQTAGLIPMCHPINITHCQVDFTLAPETASIDIEAMVRINAGTGVEMEALTAVSIAALTIYDMCKSTDRAMTIENLRLLEKSGGRSGHFIRSEPKQTG